MTFPGPEGLGRGLVVTPDAALRSDLAAAADWQRVRVDVGVLAEASPGDGHAPNAQPGGGALAETVERLHRAWANRQRVVVELDLPAEVVRSLRDPMIVDVEPHLLSAEYTLLTERLHFLLWRNNYDARNGRPVWWWANKASRVGMTAGGQADVVLADGAEAWVDGGPRQPLGLPVVHAETVDLRLEALNRGRDPAEFGPLRPQPPPGGAGGDGTRLAPDQQGAVEHPRGPVRVVAPAGSGKTRTLNARLLHLVDDRRVEASLVCAVAYNNRAAAEMRRRLGRDDLHIRTIHSLGWRIVRDGHPGATLVSTEWDVRRRLERLLPPHIRQAGRDAQAPYIEALSDVRIALRDPKTVEAERGDVAGFADVFERYRADLSRNNEWDHDEQVYEAIRLLLANPQLRARWQSRCRHLLVDEFQDLTPAYMLLLRLLASPSLNVFGVGDDDQTIYGYAGADPGFLLGYERLFPGAGEAALEVSYRCPPEVVTAVGHLLVNNRKRIPKTVRSATGAESTSPDTLKIIRTSDETLATVASEIVTAWRADGVPSQEMAVLGRVNSMLLPVLAALEEAGIATRCRLDDLLLRRNLVRAALAWMRLAARPASMNRYDLLTAARRPGRKINRLSRDLLKASEVSLRQLAALGVRLNERQGEHWEGFVTDIGEASGLVERGCDSRTLLEFLMNDIGLGKAAGSMDSSRTRPDKGAHTDDLLALRRAAAVYRDPATFGRQLKGLLEHSGEEGEGILLTTVHRVKGLEWDRVLVFAADETLMPHRLATDIEEERRVMHVAVTRCRHQVVVLADAARPSPFLDELQGRPAQPETPEPRSARPTLLEAIKGPGRRRSTRSAPATDEAPYDEALFETLRGWRLEESRRRKVPAYVVFDDRTLKSIARRKPATDFDLSAVYGVGPRKMADYGKAVLEIVREHRTDRSPA